MTTTLRVVLDAPVPADLSEASQELAAALVRTAPSGCAVAALVPATPDDELARLRGRVPGLAAVDAAPLPRRELAASWQLGIASGSSRGMIHAPTLFAPLVKHDRVYDHDQIVVTVWDLSPWETPEQQSRAGVLWQKGMLRRAVKHADAVVVPTHAHAEALREIAPKLADRLRVIAGAAPDGFVVPTDHVGRRRTLDLPAEYVLIGDAALAEFEPALAAVARAGTDLPVVVLGVADEDAPAVFDAAAAAGYPEARVHVQGDLEPADRAAALGSATMLLAPSSRTAFPWRVVEALALGVPIVASASALHREVIVDGGVLVEPTAEGFADGIAQALASDAARHRLAVLAGDRGRAFSWLGAAERVWQLHADL